MNEILWPERYTPGTTDNFVSNEVIVQGLTAAEVWPCLYDTSCWPQYYKNVAEISFQGGAGPELAFDLDFRFTTFAFPVQAHVTEFVPPSPGQPARLAWSGLIEGDETSQLDVLHAWLIEDLPGGRVRVLTQESQIGQPARDMAVTKPNPMLNAHQDWLDGLIRTVQAKKARP